MSHGANGWLPLTADQLQFLGSTWALPSAQRPRLDPTLLWWDVTSGRHFTPAGTLGSLPVLVEAKPPMTIDDLAQHGLSGTPALASQVNARFTTGFVRPMDLHRLLCTAQRVQLGLAAVPRNVGHDATLIQSSAAAGKPLVGVIDDGCAFLNKHFAVSPEDHAAGRPTESRVRWLWDQGRSSSSASRALWTETAFGYGAELTKQGFDAAQAARLSGGEAAGYRAIDFLVDAVGQPPLDSHGTHVTGLAAGAIDRLLPWCSSGQGGAASESDIAFVALPRATIADTSGLSLAMPLLNGVHYVLSKAGPKQPVVVNLSLGHYGGPHDASDLLSGALLELVQREWDRGRPLVLVTGAGNGFESATHAHWLADPQRGLPPGATAQWLWDIPAGDRTASFLHVWSEHALNLAVTDPNHLHCLPALAADDAAVLWRDGQAVALASSLTDPATGDGRHLHISMAPTLVFGGGVGATSGVWSVSVTNTHRNKACRFDAWVDRDDAPFGSLSGPRAPSRLLDATDKKVVTGERTLNALADPQCTLAVAAAVLTDGVLSSYSASGGGRGGQTNRRPLLAMPADENAALAGLPGPGVLSGAMQRIGGSSISCALLTREVVDQLAVHGPPSDFATLQSDLVARLIPRPPRKVPPDLRAGAGVGHALVCRK